MKSVLILAALATSAATAAPAPAPLPVHVGGRVIADADGGLTFGWPGAYFESRFRGTGVRVRFDAPSDHLRLLVDGEERILFEAPGLVDTQIERLSDGEHVVRLEKLTESQQGGSRFLGFLPAAGSVPLPAPARVRQIEFIGDSHSVGYGNRSSTQTCTQREIHDRTDTQQAFGPIVAHHYDADYRIHAFSGFGIVRNYDGGSRGLDLPTLYPRLKPDDGAKLETSDPAWRPQIVVVNLGTNDFSTPLNPDERWRDQASLKQAYSAGYVGFVSGLQKRYPGARFILMAPEAFRADVEKVATALNARNPGRTSVVPVAGLDLAACDWHPSLADHRKLARLVEERVDQLGAFGPAAAAAHP